MFAFLLLGCVQEMSVTYYAEGCVDWDFAEDSRVVTEPSDGDIIFQRQGITQSCDASFQPEIGAQRHLIQVFESWDLPETDDDCETCFFASVVLHEPRSGEYELQWFEGRDSLTPVGLVSLTVE